MFTSPLQVNQLRDKTIIFTGGINEALSNLEMKPGTCFRMTNYEEISGEFHGYRSVMGYEVIDGTTVNIESPIESGTYIDVSYPSDVPVPFATGDDVTDRDDTAREDRRDDINDVPLTGGGYLKGAFDFNGDYFVVAYEIAAGTHLLFRMTENGGAGWEEITSFPTIEEGYGVDAGINYNISIGRMELFPTTTLNATPNTDIAVMCNGISPAIILYVEDDGDYTCTSLVESNSDDYDGSYTLRLPSDPTIATGYPLRSIIYNQRLHLAFQYGTLFVSHVGDPFYFDNALKSAGVWWLSSEITNLIEGPSSLVVFMEKGIDVITPSDPDVITGFDEIKETFSSTSGAYADTAQRILGRILFCDDRGVTSMASTEKYGNFEISNFSKNVQRTYQSNKDNIVGTAIDRNRNQYIVYFSDGTGITITIDIVGAYSVFTNRGTSLFALSTSINTVWGVRKESKRLFTKTSDSYLRLQHEDAQSFDGDEITSSFTTAYHSYGYPTRYKTFQRLLFEIQSRKHNIFYFRPIFDYDYNTPNASQYETDAAPSNSIWGEEVWNSFEWGGTGAVNQEYSYINGIGTNMAVEVMCSSKYHNPHVIQNMIVSYALSGPSF